MQTFSSHSSVDLTETKISFYQTNLKLFAIPIDNLLTVTSHAPSICRSCFYHFRHLITSGILRLMAKTVACTLVGSWLDYADAHGIPCFNLKITLSCDHLNYYHLNFTWGWVSIFSCLSKVSWKICTFLHNHFIVPFCLADFNYCTSNYPNEYWFPCLCFLS